MRLKIVENKLKKNRNQSAILQSLIILFSLVVFVAGQTKTGEPVQNLEPGKSFACEMKGGDASRYQITLMNGQLLKLTVEQRGIDVLITTFSPDGAKMSEFDSPNGGQGPEPVSIAAKTSGIFQIEVRSLEADAPAGRYEINIDEILSAEQYQKQLAEEKARDKSVIAELKKQAIPLQSLTVGDGFGDLQPLKKILKDVNIIGFGEATHGTHEFFTFKHRMVEFLVREMNFTVFLIEASASASTAINDYVLYGKGNRAEVLASQKFWIPDTVEFSEMLDWMQAYNRNLPEEKKIKFAGFDPQSNEQAMQSVVAYLQKVKPEKVSAAKTLFQSLQKEDDNAAIFAPTKISLSQLLETYKLLAYFVLNKTDLMRKSSESEYEKVLRNLRLIAQFAEINSRSAVSPQDYETRDEFMAENIQTIISRQKPETRFIVWAHNAHISTRGEGGNRTMGGYLREVFGKKYYAIGFSFNRGSFQAQNIDEKEVKVQEFTLEAAPEKTIDWYFSQTGIKNFIIDFRNLPKDDLFSVWLQTERRMYWVGALFSNRWSEAQKTQPFVLSRDFDGIIFIEQTTRAVPTVTGKRKDL